MLRRCRRSRDRIPEARWRAREGAWRAGRPRPGGRLRGLLLVVLFGAVGVLDQVVAGRLARRHGRRGGRVAAGPLGAAVARRGPQHPRAIVALGVLGASLFYGDTLITPA